MYGRLRLRASAWLRDRRGGCWFLGNSSSERRTPLVNVILITSVYQRIWHILIELNKFCNMYILTESKSEITAAGFRIDIDHVMNLPFENESGISRREKHPVCAIIIDDHPWITSRYFSTKSTAFGLCEILSSRKLKRCEQRNMEIIKWSSAVRESRTVESILSPCESVFVVTFHLVMKLSF